MTEQNQNKDAEPIISEEEKLAIKKAKTKARYKRHYEKNKENLKAKAVAWARKNRDLVRERNRKKSKQYSRTYYLKSKDKILESGKRWRKKNPDAFRNILKRHRAKRRLRDPLFVVKEKLRACVRAAFKRIKQDKFSDTQKLLGCNWQEAKNHIESLWQEGMSWENHGNGPGTWNIDHIRPVCSFGEDEIHLINDIKNLQPLWWEENNKKSGEWQ